MPNAGGWRIARAALLVVGVIVVCFGVYWLTQWFRIEQRESRCFAAINSDDPQEAATALWDAQEILRPGAPRRKLRAKIEEFLKLREPFRLRAAILIAVNSELPDLRIADTEDGFTRVKQAVEIYNKVAAKETIFLRKEGGKVVLMVRQTS